MRSPSSHRYFLGFQPDPATLGHVRNVSDVLGLGCAAVGEERLHLTLFVVAEMRQRNTDIARKIDAVLRPIPLTAPRIKLGKASSGAQGAYLESIGRRFEIAHFYRQLITLLAPLGIESLHRKNGLNPHITLAYQCNLPEARIVHPFEWVPQQLLLIESCVGLGVHNIMARWPLLPPRQGELALWSEPVHLGFGKNDAGPPLVMPSIARHRSNDSIAEPLSALNV